MVLSKGYSHEYLGIMGHVACRSTVYEAKGEIPAKTEEEKHLQHEQTPIQLNWR